MFTFNKSLASCLVVDLPGPQQVQALEPSEAVKRPAGQSRQAAQPV